MIRFLIFMLFVARIQVQAQTNTGVSNTLDAYWNLASTPSQGQVTLNSGIASAPEPSSMRNEVIMQQEGINNTALLSITGGTQNRLEINQYNGYNYADVALSGINNSILLNQNGSNNSVSFGLGGENNRFTLNQDGGDRIQMLGLQQANTRLEISQGSGSNALTIDNTALFRDANGGGIPNLRIEQSGGAAATIQNGRIFGN